MRCISLWQPFASLVSFEEKLIETKHWPTSHRGPLAIHAAKRWTREERELVGQFAFRDALERHGVQKCPADLPFGCIVAVLDVLDCRPTGWITRNWSLLQLGQWEREFGNYAPGRYGWLLGNVRRLAVPVPVVGRQGFFEVDDALLEGGLSHVND